MDVKPRLQLAYKIHNFSSKNLVRSSLPVVYLPMPFTEDCLVTIVKDGRGFSLDVDECLYVPTYLR